MIRYQYDLVCPRCGKTSEIVSPRDYISVNCGDCLMSNVEVVEMKIVHTTPIIPKLLKEETK